MVRFGFFLMALFLLACSDDTSSGESDSDSTFEGLSSRFKKVALPYQLSDSGLMRNKDTAVVRNPDLLAALDTARKNVFSKGSKVKYTPLGRIDVPDKETYFIVKGTAGSKRAAFLVTYDQEKLTSVFPFLIPDTDAETSQTSSIDRYFSITRNVLRKLPDDLVAEGKDVYVYNYDAKQFTLIMTDLLDESKAELVNPIDTLPRTHSLAADYRRNKKNIVSIRDGSKPDRVRFFVHFEEDGGECIGEIRGEAVLLSSTTAVFRQPGEPCVLQFSFAASSVSLSELEGCGSHRGFKCLFEGTFPRRKESASSSRKKEKETREREG